MSAYMTKVPENFGEAVLFVGELRRELASSNISHSRIHTNLVSRYKMEKIEKMSKPKNVSNDAWENTSRLEKWKSIFNNESNNFIFYEFVQCVHSIFSDAAVFGRKMKLLYSILNNRIHEYVEKGEVSEYSILNNRIDEYVEKGEVSETAFREDYLNNIIKCLDLTTVN